MSKRYFYLFVILISSKLFSLTPYTFYDVGNFGVEMDSQNWFEVISWNISLPSIYIRDRDSDFGLGVQSILYTSEISEEDPSLSFFDTQLYWSPLLDSEFNILGPYAEISSSLKRFELDIQVGLKYAFFTAVLDNRFPSMFVYRPMDVEISYSLMNCRFHIGYKLDLTLGFEALQEKLESKIVEIEAQ